MAAHGQEHTLVSPNCRPDAAEHVAREIERSFFDRLATGGKAFNPFKKRGWQTLNMRFRRMVPQLKTPRLLDVGCGTGQSRQIYRAYIDEYVGVDLSPLAVSIAAKQFPNDQWRVCDACDLPFPDEHFDIVAFSSVLHHIPNLGDALREGHRVLKPGGAAFAFDPNFFHPAMALFRSPKSPFYLSQGVSPNERPLRPVELRRAFEAAGFISIRQRCQSDIPYRRLAPTFLDLFRSTYNLADRVWEYVGFGRWFGTFVITRAVKPIMN